MPPRRFVGRHARIAVLDLAMLIAFLVLMEPARASGFVWHEWLGLGIIPALVLHIVFSWSWTAGAWRRLASDTHARTRINFLLNVVLFVMMLVVIVSGIMISDYALPAVGIPTIGTHRWEPLHNLTSSLLMIVVGLHIALNWSWIKGAYRRYVAGAFARPAIKQETQS